MKNKILKLIILAVIIILTVSCSSSENNRNGKHSEHNDGYFEYDGGVWSSMVYKIEERTIDNCEYIIIFGSDGRNIIHKANCKNPEHICH